jgi:hypothetical protein
MKLMTTTIEEPASPVKNRITSNCMPRCTSEVTTMIVAREEVAVANSDSICFREAVKGYFGNRSEALWEVREFLLISSGPYLSEDTRMAA